MQDSMPFAERLSPDTIAKLERAAEQRFRSADILRDQKRQLAALYFYGYSAEIWLAAAYFRSAGFGPHDTIDRDTRQRRMAQARQLKLMTSDPHPLVGWAKLLEWHRSASGVLANTAAQRLKEAVKNSIEIYKFWRPELRYKVVQITDNQVLTVRRAANWLKNNYTQF